MKRANGRVNHENNGVRNLEKLSEMDLFKTFYKDTIGEDPDEEQCKMMELALQVVRNRGGKSMKPLKLKMKNFGPYKDAEVDFTKFSESPRFF